MPLYFDPNYLALAINGKQPPETIKVELTRREIGILKLMTGELVACDPFWIRYGAVPFTQKLAKGNYPVTITIARFESRTDERVTFASFRLSDADIVAWEMMLLPEQDISQLGDKHFYGYGVDAGTGCFLDKKVARFLYENENRDTIQDKLMETLRSNYKFTRNWGEIAVEDGNIIAFSSGWGDGAYPTFAAFDEDNNVVAVVTDFMCFYGEYHESNTAS
ncbi:MAG: DUF4241 domain-containing protein [Chloroflexota bacterium]